MLRYGLDIDDTGLVEGEWSTQTLNVTGHDFITLYVGLNADLEFALFDEIMLTTSATPP
eukprot:COSAG04_NODE_20838_length_385_cov_0.898601_1_plen_58_part_10